MLGLWHPAIDPCQSSVCGGTHECKLQQRLGPGIPGRSSQGLSAWLTQPSTSRAQSPRVSSTQSGPDMSSRTKRRTSTPMSWAPLQDPGRCQTIRSASVCAQTKYLRDASSGMPNIIAVAELRTTLPHTPWASEKQVSIRYHPIRGHAIAFHA